MIEFVNDPVLD